MKNTFLVDLLYIFIVLFPSTTKCQHQSTNVLDVNSASSVAYFTVIDGRIPYSVRSEISINYNNEYDTIIYDYYYINNKHYSENIKILDSISDTVTVLLDFYFNEPLGPTVVKTHHYRDSMPLGRFKLVQIVSITNFRSKQYHIYYVLDPPLRTFPCYEKRFGPKKRFYSKIFACFYPYSYNQYSKRRKAKPVY